MLSRLVRQLACLKDSILCEHVTVIKLFLLHIVSRAYTELRAGVVNLRANDHEFPHFNYDVLFLVGLELTSLNAVLLGRRGIRLSCP